MTTFNVEFLDYAAIRVKDIKTSVNWYEKVLGLKSYEPSEWGKFPIFRLSNKTGIALLPAKTDDKKLEETLKNVNVDHVAFNVTREDLKRQKKDLKN